MKIIPLCLIPVALVAIASGAVTETISQTHPLAADGVVALTNVNGAVTITAWDRNEVAIEAVKKAPNAEDLARIHVNIDAQPARLTITTVYEKSGLLGRSVRGEVRYTLHVPAGVRLDKIESVNSEVTVTGVHGSLAVRSVNGGIRLDGAQAKVDVHTVNGGIRVAFDRLPADGSSNVETVNGGVELLLPADAGAQIDARTVNGGIRSDLPVTVENSGKARLRGTLGAGGATLKVRSVNGGITLRKN